MKKFALGVALMLPAVTIAAAANADDRLSSAAEVLQDVMSSPDKGIPQDLFNKAQCVIVIPSMIKGAFVVGAEYGKGFAVCRRSDGVGWGAPAAVVMEGGSFGFQIGGSSTDVVALVMSQHGMQKLMGDKFTLGADASVAAGPVGRTAGAGTDVALRSDILAWSRARGLFAGVSLNGASLRPDEHADEELYGHKINNHEVLGGGVAPPAAAQPLRSELDKFSMMK